MDLIELLAKQLGLFGIDGSDCAPGHMENSFAHPPQYND
jgi:hypothetical protein